MIIVVIGRAGSGKSVISKEICKLTKLPLVEMSSVVMSVMTEKSKEHLGGCFTKKRSKKERGQINIDKDCQEDKDFDWLWKAVHEEILKVGKGDNKSCVVSGIREPYLLHKILTEPTIGDDVLVIAIMASIFNRYSRLCSRDGFISVKEFKSIDNGTKEKDDYVGDNELGLDITLSGCDVIVDSNKPLEQVVKEIDKVLFDKGVYCKIRK